jgi:two-component system, OmpR family, KDP operon response regulator KdpE
MAMRVLIADDDSDLAQLIGMSARTLWPEAAITIAQDGREALQAFAVERPDLVILDVAMPPPDGLEVCRRIRAESRVPILMLTVRDGTVDEVRALDGGADDYLTKPVDSLRLLARLRALARRASAPPVEHGRAHGPDFVLGDLAIDFATREVRLRGEVLDLTPTEYVLLEELVRHAGTVMPHHLLLERVWGPEYTNDVHYLKVFVSRLRQKLGDDADRPRYIQTQWGIGYRFVPQR